MDARDNTSAPNEDSDPLPDRAARESVQRALDQCLEEGQLHRLYQLATSLNQLCHGEARDA